MAPQPEQQAREEIDRLLKLAGWQVFDVAQANIHAARGVALREFPLNTGHGFADYLLYVDGKAAGVIEAKKAGATLTGVESQSARYAAGLPATLPAWCRPLPFLYESTGYETHFTNGLDPEPRARNAFAFHRPDTLAEWLAYASPAQSAGGVNAPPATFLTRVRSLPPLMEEGLWPAQIKAIKNLEASLAADKPRALIQMATGSGKTYTAISFIYRLIKFAGARRVLFLVDRGNLGRQTKKEFDQYVSPYNNFKFGEEYIVHHLSGNTLDKSARVVISTIQRMYSMLKGRELPEEDDEHSAEGMESLFKDVPPIEYNPAIPIETFDIIVTDEAHRSIYNLWRQVLEYYDAYLVGLTATPNKQTFGFFNKNLVMEYGHDQAVADGVNVNYDVYRIRTEVTEAGSTVEAGYWVQVMDRDTRKRSDWQLDEDFDYNPAELDRSVQAPDQIRTVVRTIRDRWKTEMFPQRQELPKTLVFAKDDNHAEAIVQILREEFGRGNEFAQKITYRSTGDTPENLIRAFRSSYYPRIAVTVDMIATGTDIKPVEIVVFMRSVKSRSFFEQMKGRGVRIIERADLRAVNPGEHVVKDHFVIVDAVGVCERDKTDSRPMDQKKAVPFDKLLQAVALGNVEPEVLSSIAARLARLERDIGDADKSKVVEISGGHSLKDLARNIVDAIRFSPSHAGAGEGRGEGGEGLLQQAVKPLADPKLRNLILELRQKADQIIDIVTQDNLIEAGFSAAATERAKSLVQTFEAFIEKHKDEITALQILYNRPTKAPLRFEDIKALADKLHAPPHLFDESVLWQAYAALDKSKVKGASARRILTDLVSLVRFAMHQENELVPYPERVAANFKAWIAQATRHSRESGNPESFTTEQLHWLEMIRDHIAANLGIEIEDFEYAPFNKEGGLGRVHQLFGEQLPEVIAELNRELVA